MTATQPGTLLTRRGGLALAAACAWPVVFPGSARAQASGTTWRPITPAEEQFVQSIEAPLHAILREAAQRMPGRWEIRLRTDPHQRHELDDAHHQGRPHELRVELSMDWQPSDAELATQDAAIHRHAQEAARFDPIPDHLNRRNPEHRQNLSVMLVANAYGFTPTSIAGAASLGELTQVPGTAFSYLRWRSMGIGAPKRIVFLGEFTRRAGEGGERLVETFGRVSDCRNLRTIIIEIASSEDRSQAFLAGLDIARLNALIRDL